MYWWVSWVFANISASISWLTVLFSCFGLFLLFFSLYFLFLCAGSEEELFGYVSTRKRQTKENCEKMLGRKIINYCGGEGMCVCVSVCAWKMARNTESLRFSKYLSKSITNFTNVVQENRSDTEKLILNI